MEIRPMKIEDAEEVWSTGSSEVNFQVTKSSPNFWSKEQLKRIIKSNEDVLLVALEDDLMVGFSVSLYHEPSQKATFENLWVRENVRGKGVGKLLLKETTLLLKEKGCTYICALMKKDNLPIRELFKKEGFEEGYLFYWMGKII